MLWTIEKCLARHLSVRCAISAHISLFFPHSRFVKCTIQHCLFLVLRQPKLASWAAQICADTSASLSPFLTCVLGEREKSAVSPGDWPETPLASRPDCISTEQTTSYQTGQWRERRSKRTWKLMNTSQVTAAQRQFTTDVFRKLQEGKDNLSKCGEEAPSFWFKREKKTPPTACQYLPFQFVKREIGLHQLESLIWMPYPTPPPFFKLSNQHSSGFRKWDESRTSH